MNDERCFVQFMHPGGESAMRQGLLPWNTLATTHRRKFLVTSGSLMRTATESPVRGELMFWGEWEPPSAHSPAPGSSPGLPRSFARPLLTTAEEPRDLQNTDPFVFGSQFLYANCKQWTTVRRRPERGIEVRGRVATQLRYLAPGSVILFGSHRGGSFLLDTLFVVRESIDLPPPDSAAEVRGLVPAEYFDVTIGPTYANHYRHPEDHYRLYKGATPELRANSMFSFFPCHEAAGFARPAITLPGIINPANRMATILNRGLPVERMVSLWSDVVRQVVASGLSLGVRAEMPRGADRGP